MKPMMVLLFCIMLSATVVAAQPCDSYACDSAAVTQILDTNGILGIAIDSVTDSAGGRVVALRLVAGDCNSRNIPLPITVLPAEIGKLTGLIRLDLSCNAIDSIPPDIATLSNLVVLQLEANRLDELPPIIMTMPALASLILWSNPLSALSGAFRAWADTAVPGWERPLTLVSPVGGEVYHVGDSLLIQWIADPRFVMIVDVSMSLDNGDSLFYPDGWRSVHPGDPDWGRMRRFIGDPRWVSDSCMIRLSDWLSPDHIVVSPSVFSIKPALSARGMIVRESGAPGIAITRYASGVRVRVTTPAASQVSVSLHDVRGRLVRTLVANDRRRGSRVVDVDSRVCAGGTYLLRVQAAQHSMVTRLVLGQ